MTELVTNQKNKNTQHKTNKNKSPSEQILLLFNMLTLRKLYVKLYCRDHPRLETRILIFSALVSSRKVLVIQRCVR